MDKLMLVLLLVLFGGFIFIIFLVGNGMILSAMCGEEALDWSEFGIFYIVAIIADIILLCLVLSKIIPRVRSSYHLMRNGLKNRKVEKRASKKLKKILEDETLYVNRLQELRDKGISERKIKRTLHFCQLIESIDGKEQLQECMTKVGEKQVILDEINEIEGRIFGIAECCEKAGDVEKCKYYLALLKAHMITPEIVSLEKECELQQSLRELERKAIRSWIKGVLLTLVILVAVFAGLYIQDTPYRNLRSMVEDQTLTWEMCNRRNREGKDSYYEYLVSKKGYKFLAAELTKLHSEEDVSKAMWLLCIMPNCINGYDLAASPSFIQWIVGYAKANGIRSTDKEGADDTWYNVFYDVDGYRITIDAYEDKASAIDEMDDFSISDGKNRSHIHTKYRNVDETIPIIK